MAKIIKLLDNSSQGDIYVNSDQILWFHSVEGADPDGAKSKIYIADNPHRVFYLDNTVEEIGNQINN